MPVFTEDSGNKMIGGNALARGSTRQIIVPTSLHGRGPDCQLLFPVGVSYDLSAKVTRLGRYFYLPLDTCKLASRPKGGLVFFFP